MTSVGDIVQSARQAQRHWASVSTAKRLRPIVALKSAIASTPNRFAASCGRSNTAESLAAEVLPLADACDFLQRSARKILKPWRPGLIGRPMWLFGVRSEVRPDPWGTVLVVGPSNYPLMLPGIQILQALVAGNSVVVKPAVGCSEPMKLLQKELHAAGMPDHLLQILPEDPAAVSEAISAGIDKLVLTGSVTTGRAIQRMLADPLVPSILELSGCDACFVDQSADLDRLVRCLIFSLFLNGSQTCMAARRVFVHQDIAAAVEKRLQLQIAIESYRFPVGTIPEKVARLAAGLVDRAVINGATLSVDGIDRTQSQPRLTRPTILTHASPDSDLLKEDVFAPVMSLVTVSSMDEAIQENRKCPYALSATVFAQDRKILHTLCQTIDAGCIVANDIIAITADPRVPFGGRGQSGFGVSRGREGLLQMTQPKTILVRTGRWLPHLDSPTPHDADVLNHLITVSHGNPLQKLKASIGITKSSLAQRTFRRRQAKPDPT